LRSVTLLAGVLGRAGERGQQRRLADAEEGVTTWRTPRDIAHFIDKDAESKASEALEAAKTATAEGILDDKPLTREDFLTDEELLREMDTPGIGPRP